MKGFSNKVKRYWVNKIISDKSPVEMQIQVLSLFMRMEVICQILKAANQATPVASPTEPLKKDGDGRE